MELLERRNPVNMASVTQLRISQEKIRITQKLSELSIQKREIERKMAIINSGIKMLDVSPVLYFMYNDFV
jgi:hypothetical protein